MVGVSSGLVEFCVALGGLEGVFRLEGVFSSVCRGGVFDMCVVISGGFLEKVVLRLYCGG